MSRPSSKHKNSSSDKRPVNNRRYDGLRGDRGFGGRWITLNEAKAYSVDSATEWWNHPRIRPTHEKPIWEYQNSDMYMGQWNENCDIPLEDGFGITYNHYPIPTSQGLIHVGHWKNGCLDGSGESFWLSSCKIWKSNHCPGSAITVTTRHGKHLRKRGVPFRYKGNYRNDQKCDPQAVVTLKDGTTRRGPWEHDKPVGDWHIHTLIVGCSTPRLSVARSSVENGNIGVASSVASSVANQNHNLNLEADLQTEDTDNESLNNGTSRTRKRARSSSAASSVVTPDNRESSGQRCPLQRRRRASTRRYTPCDPEIIALLSSDDDDEDDDNNNYYYNNMEDDRKPAASVKREEADISVAATQDDNDNAESPTNNNGVKNEDQASIGNTIKSEAEEKSVRVQALSNFIANNVIASNPNPETLLKYAVALYEQGFESVGMIQTYLKPRHIQKFSWMAELHKELFTEYVETEEMERT